MKPVARQALLHSANRSCPLLSTLRCSFSPLVHTFIHVLLHTGIFRSICQVDAAEPVR